MAQRSRHNPDRKGKQKEENAETRYPTVYRVMLEGVGFQQHGGYDKTKHGTFDEYMDRDVIPTFKNVYKALLKERSTTDKCRYYNIGTNAKVVNSYARVVYSDPPYFLAFDRNLIKEFLTPDDQRIFFEEIADGMERRYHYSQKGYQFDPVKVRRSDARVRRFGIRETGTAISRPATDDLPPLGTRLSTRGAYQVGIPFKTYKVDFPLEEVEMEGEDEAFDDGERSEDEDTSDANEYGDLAGFVVSGKRPFKDNKNYVPKKKKKQKTVPPRQEMPPPQQAIPERIDDDFLENPPAYNLGPISQKTLWQYKYRPELSLLPVLSHSLVSSDPIFTNPTEVNNAREGLYFNDVARDNGRLYLRGAREYWENINPHLVYDLTSRLAGTPDEIAIYLLQIDYPNDLINNIIRDVITYKNSSTHFVDDQLKPIDPEHFYPYYHEIVRTIQQYGAVVPE